MRPNTVRHARVAVRTEDFPKDGRPEIAVMGRSNVGKSSLLNKLFGRVGMARVSKTPGRTREVHFYLIDERIYLVDLPGFGYARVSTTTRRQWGRLVEAYLDRPEGLALAVQLVDVRHDPTVLDRQMTAALMDRGMPLAIALTKADKVSSQACVKAKARAMEVLALPPDAALFVTSAKTGRGVPELARHIHQAAEAAAAGAR